MGGGGYANRTRRSRSFDALRTPRDDSDGENEGGIESNCVGEKLTGRDRREDRSPGAAPSRLRKTGGMSPQCFPYFTVSDAFVRGKKYVGMESALLKQSEF